MVRSSLPAAVAAALLAVSVATRVAFGVAASDGPSKVIPPNRVGTWRLDSLLDQAEINGTDPSDVDPALFVLQDLRFEEGNGGAAVVELPFGQASIERGDHCLRLHAKGKLGVFTIPVPKVKTVDWGMLALHVRTSDAAAVGVVAQAILKQQIEAMIQ